jgi:carbon monoxide dehydrogenase subunit G
MLISSDFEVAQPVGRVWTFFDDIRQVAACLPGAELTDDLGNDTYAGTVGVRMGPVRMTFAGTAKVERDEADRRVVVDASGADQKGRGQAAMLVTATLAATPQGTRVMVQQDIQLSGAAAQFGRGMVADVSAVLVRDFATNMQNRLIALEKGLDPDQVGAAKPAGGFAIALRATWMALARVARRFFAPYRPVSG